VNYITITDHAQLGEYCRELATSSSIAIDTEFVSEQTYQSELCLIQVNADGRLAVIDAPAIADMRPFWETLVADGHETVVHAGRSEMEFCLQAVERIPERLFDVQIAAGLVGIEYPAGYRTLLIRLLGESPEKHETRTDWRRRPLSQRQLEYAVEDVRHLPQIREILYGKLVELGRLEWLNEEMAALRDELDHARSSERWRRVSGNAGLDQRSLAIVRELWKWRESEARRRDQPARRVLRDDLIIELARRQTADVKRIRAVRGMEYSNVVRHLGELAACVERALALPKEECPPRIPRETTPQLSVLGQFLFAALGSVCRQAQLAPNLVGSPTDIRDWIAHRTAKGDRQRQPPQLARGWRAQFVGRLFDDLLDGKTSVRIGDPNSDHPLILHPT
jgi:ribonuclease D